MISHPPLRLHSKTSGLVLAGRLCLGILLLLLLFTPHRNLAQQAPPASPPAPTSAVSSANGSQFAGFGRVRTMSHGPTAQPGPDTPREDRVQAGPERRAGHM